MTQASPRPHRDGGKIVLKTRRFWPATLRSVDQIGQNTLAWASVRECHLNLNVGDPRALVTLMACPLRSKSRPEWKWLGSFGSGIG